MGIDDRDKAAGKAYTYAFKSAIMKTFRLRYGYDPDHDESFPIYAVEEQKKEAKEAMSEPKKAPNGKKKPDEQMMSEAQATYISGLMNKNDVPTDAVIEKFGVNPKCDKVTMKTAREIIQWIKDEGYLPF